MAGIPNERRLPEDVRRGGGTPATNASRGSARLETTFCLSIPKHPTKPAPMSVGPVYPYEVPPTCFTAMRC